MSEEKLRLLFGKQRDQHVSPTDSCLGDDQIARMLEPESPGDGHIGLRTHVADCPYCASRLADALKPSAASAASGLSASRHKPRRRLRHLATAAAAGAVAVTLFWLQPDSGIISGDNFELRNARQPQVVPSLTFPTEGQLVSPADMTVRWMPVTDAMHYSVRIVDDYGRIIVDAFSDTAEYALPSNIRLAPGTDYYVKVDAYIVGDKAVSANHIRFTIAD